VYLVLIDVKIILGEGGEEEHNLGLDNGVYVRIGRIVVVHCTARSSCPSAGRLRATGGHACAGSRFRDNVVGVGWKRVGWEASFVGRESLDDPPSTKPAQDSSEQPNTATAISHPRSAHVGFFGLRFNFGGCVALWHRLHGQLPAKYR